MFLQIVTAARDPERRSVLIFGEPGLNKENIATLLHFGGPDRLKPMVQVMGRCCQVEPWGPVPLGWQVATGCEGNNLSRHHDSQDIFTACRCGWADQGLLMMQSPTSLVHFIHPMGVLMAEPSPAVLVSDQVDCTEMDPFMTELFGRGSREGLLHWIRDGTLAINNVHKAVRRGSSCTCLCCDRPVQIAHLESQYLLQCVPSSAHTCRGCRASHTAQVCCWPRA